MAHPRSRPAARKPSQPATPAKRVARRKPSPARVPRAAQDEAAATATPVPAPAAITQSPPGKREKSEKVIRDSFSMPRADYELIGKLKKRCLALGVAIKKSELLRAGLAVLTQLPDDRLAATANAVHTVRTGRPPGKKKKRGKGNGA